MPRNDMHQLTQLNGVRLTARQGQSRLFTSQLRVEAAQADCKCLKGRQGISIIHGEHVFPNFPKLENDFVVVRWSRLRIRRSSSSSSSSSGLCGGNQLKILYRCNCHPTTEVEAPALQLLVPTGGLVLENQGPRFAVIIFVRQPSHLGKSWAAEFSGVVQRLWEWDAPERVFKRSWNEFWLSRHHATGFKGWDGNWLHNAIHLPWTTCPKHVQFVCDLSYVVTPGWYFWRYFLGIETTACPPRRWDVRTCRRRLRVVYQKLCAKEIRPAESSKDVDINNSANSDILSFSSSWLCMSLTNIWHKIILPTTPYARCKAENIFLDKQKSCNYF